MIHCSKLGMTGEESLSSSGGLSRQNQRRCRNPFTCLAPVFGSSSGLGESLEVSSKIKTVLAFLY